MKKSFLSIILLIFLIKSNLYAQSQKLWGKSITQEAINKDVNESAIDLDGNIYLTGSFSGKYMIGNDIQITAIGGQDNYLAKYDSLGNFLWVKRFGSTDYLSTEYEEEKEIVSKIKISGNNIYLTGSFYRKINFNTPFEIGTNELISDGSSDIYLANFDTDGNFKWAKRAGGTGQDFSTGLCLSNGNIYITGSYMKVANFNTPSSTNTNILNNPSQFSEDTFIAKYSSSGSIVWLKRAGTDYYDIGKEIESDANGLYLLGEFQSYMDFNSVYTPNEYTDLVANQGNLNEIYLAKYDFDGNYLWSKRAGGFRNRAISLTTNSQGIFLLGAQSGNPNDNSNESIINFNNHPDLSQYNLPDFDNHCFLAKFNSSGVFQWAKRTGILFNYPVATIFNRGPNRIKLTSGLNDIYIHTTVNKGYLNINFNSLNLNFGTPYVAGQNEIAVSGSSTDESIFIKFNGINGNYIWAKRAGGGQIGTPPLNQGETKANYDYSSISIKPNGSIVISGTFGGLANFNTPTNFANNNLASPAKGNVFIAQFTQNGIYQWAKKHTDIILPYAADQADNLAKKCISDLNGNLFVLGTFNGVFSENNQFVSTLNKNLYLAKYNKEGHLLWFKRAGGLEDISVFDIGVLGSEIFITGAFKGTINFNNPSLPGSNEITSIGSWDIFLAKYDTAGVFKWAKRAGGPEIDGGFGIAINSTSVFLVGSFSELANFNTPSSYSNNTLNSAGDRDIFLASFAKNNGTIQWLKRAGGTLFDEGIDIAIDNSSIFITGSFDSEIINFNTPSNSNSNTLETTSAQYFSTAGYLVKFSLGGNYLWSRRFGGEDYAKGRAVEVKNGDVYVGGNFNNQMSFSQTGSFFNGNPSNLFSEYVFTEGFLAKFNGDGVIQWYKRSGGLIRDLAISENGSSIYTVGDFYGNRVNFNTPSDNTFNYINGINYSFNIFENPTNLFYAKYNSANGSFIYAKTNDTDLPSNYDSGIGISLSGSRIFIVGERLQAYFESSAVVHCFFEGTISTNTLSGSSFCAGTNISVPFTSSTIFDTGNTFMVELSNSSGIFPEKNGHIGTGTVSPISSLLPINASGSNYKVRVVSTNPKVIGSATPALLGGFTIIAASKGGTLTGGTTVCSGSTTPIPITLSGQTGNILKWQQSSTPDFASPLDINISTTSINVGNMTADRYFRAIVQNSTCPSAYSTATGFSISPLTVAGTLSNTNGIFCAGTNNTTINLSGKTGNVIKWQSSSNSTFTSPIDIANTTTSLNVTNISFSTYYRAIVKSGACAEANTSGRQITVSSGAVTLPTTFTLNNSIFPVLSNFTITGQNTIKGLSNVLFSSSKAIELKPGFRAENGVIFQAEIGGCN